MRPILEKMLHELKCGNELVLVSIAAQKGSSPRGVGTQMLVGTNGRITGTVGGGSIELMCIHHAQSLIAKKENDVADFALQHGQNAGMVCGGDITAWFNYIPAESEAWLGVCSAALNMLDEGRAGWLVLRLDGLPCIKAENAPRSDVCDVPADIEAGMYALINGSFFIPLPIKEKVLLFGGGHCAQALVPVLNGVGFAVTVMENRAELANPALFPDAEKVIFGDYNKLDEYVNPKSYDYVVIMTSGHSHDLTLQQQLLKDPPYYVGVIGSRGKRAFIDQHLREAGIDDEVISRVHSPIGTAIKAVTPEEIAISIAGEMIYYRALMRESRGITKSGCPMH